MEECTFSYLKSPCKFCLKLLIHLKRDVLLVRRKNQNFVTHALFHCIPVHAISYFTSYALGILNLIDWLATHHALTRTPSPFFQALFTFSRTRIIGIFIPQLGSRVLGTGVDEVDVRGGGGPGAAPTMRAGRTVDSCPDTCRRHGEPIRHARWRVHVGDRRLWRGLFVGDTANTVARHHRWRRRATLLLVSIFRFSDVGLKAAKHNFQIIIVIIECRASGRCRCNCHIIFANISELHLSPRATFDIAGCCLN